MWRKAIWCLVAFAGSAHATDLGVHGRLFDIEEVDMRVLVARSLARADLEAPREALRRSWDTYASDRLVTFDLPPATESRTYYVDPTVELTEDIMGMRQDANGQWTWGVLFPRGTRVNPLDHVRPSAWLLYVDGRSQAQVDMAVDMLRQSPERIRVILTAGDPLALAEKVRLPIYYATAQQIERFSLTATPSLVRPGEGEHARMLEIQVFAAEAGS